MTALIDGLLDRVTMYRLVLYHLAALLLAATVLASFGLVPHAPVAIALSFAVVLSVSWLTNFVFARVFRAPANVESVYISALILVLICDPALPSDSAGLGALVFAAVWANASKYIFAVGRKHVFNPAAFGALASGLLLDHPASWWAAASLPLLPLTVVGGLLIVRKIRRFDVAALFAGAALAALLAATPVRDFELAVREALFYSPLAFFAFVIVTEPLTAPQARLPRRFFALLVGLLFAPTVHVGDFYFTPELALVIGNAFAWAVGPRGRFTLTLERAERIAADTYDFVFRPDRRLVFQPGQYLEWTLPVRRADSRGNRRYFTVASAPGDADVRLGVRFYPKGSSFKRALAALRPGETAVASQPAGSFTLPADPEAKLAFIAGGIGITPFRSMLMHLLHIDQPRPIVVVYGNERIPDVAYRDVLLESARRLGIRTVYALAGEPSPPRGVYPGTIDESLIRSAVPDFNERTFYVSGPQAMVVAVRRTLRRMGVRRRRIKVDFFPGFA